MCQKKYFFGEIQRDATTVVNIIPYTIKLHLLSEKQWRPLNNFCLSWNTMDTLCSLASKLTSTVPVLLVTRCHCYVGSRVFSCGEGWTIVVLEVVLRCDLLLRIGIVIFMFIFIILYRPLPILSNQPHTVWVNAPVTNKSHTVKAHLYPLPLISLWQEQG